MTDRVIDWALVHLVIILFPASLSVTGALAALLALTRARRGIWLYATVSLTLAGIIVILAYFSGGLAAGADADAFYADPSAVRAHSDAARIAALLVVVTAMVAVVVWRRLVRYPRELRLPGGLRTALIAGALASAVAVGYGWLLGTRIVHNRATLGRTPVNTDSQPRVP